MKLFKKKYLNLEQLEWLEHDLAVSEVVFEGKRYKITMEEES